MKAKRRKLTAAFKAQVAIEAIKEIKTLAELSKEFDVHPNMITTWKREFLENASAVFEQGAQKDDFEKERESLTNLIWRLEIERDWLKKISIKAGLPGKERIRYISEHQKISIRRQCELLEVNRSNVYYNPVGESEENMAIMKLMDEYHLEHPTYVVLQMKDYLLLLGLVANHKRIRRLLRLMGIMALYPKRNLSKLGLAKYIRPYLLKRVKINRPNKVWCVDISYIPMAKGFMYLTAIMDIYSRYIVGWGLFIENYAMDTLGRISDLVSSFYKSTYFFRCKIHVAFKLLHKFFLLPLSKFTCASGIIVFQ